MREKKNECRYGWVVNEEGSGRSWRTGNYDQNTVYIKLFSKKLKLYENNNFEFLC